MGLKDSDIEHLLQDTNIQAKLYEKISFSKKLVTKATIDLVISLQLSSKIIGWLFYKSTLMTTDSPKYHSHFFSCFTYENSLWIKTGFDKFQKKFQNLSTWNIFGSATIC